MANKRQLKKAIGNACAEMAGECIIAQEMLGTDENARQWDEIIVDIALLQSEATRRVGRNFGKADEKALTEYFRSEAEAIVAKMNALMPKKAE